MPVTGSKKRKSKVPKGNGGWGDKRDKDLCLKIVHQNEQDTTADAPVIRNTSTTTTKAAAEKAASKSLT